MVIQLQTLEQLKLYIQEFECWVWENMTQFHSIPKLVTPRNFIHTLYVHTNHTHSQCMCWHPVGRCQSTSKKTCSVHFFRNWIWDLGCFGTKFRVLVYLPFVTTLRKGQLTLKCLFSDFNFFQKQRKTLRIVVKMNQFIRFLEEFTAWQFAFEINWPLD